MINPLHAAWYADRAVQRSAAILENLPIARDTWRLRFTCPEIAVRITPGQFVMLRIADCDDPLIGRPLALYEVIPDSTGAAAAIDVVYLVKGKFTSRLAQMQPGQRVDAWGPLGNGFDSEAADHVVMAAGGIGQTPFLTLAQEYLGKGRFGQPPRPAASAGRVTLCYGARTGELLAGVEDFRRVGVDVRLATDDGSVGRRGLVTRLLEELLDESAAQRGESPLIVCCGPERMMQSVAELAARRGAPCRVSLETPMACGIGICFTCVAKVRDAHGGWDYKRTCVEGPVFDAAAIEWEI